MEASQTSLEFKQILIMKITVVNLIGLVSCLKPQQNREDNKWKTLPPKVQIKVEFPESRKYLAPIVFRKNPSKIFKIEAYLSKEVEYLFIKMSMRANTDIFS